MISVVCEICGKPARHVHAKPIKIGVSADGWNVYEAGEPHSYCDECWAKRVKE